ncbi:glycosyltransferase [Sphingomonas sp. Y38-1Y]|uniref:glycosyltransferase n=1 Tax=Sphingomonas sp. Y38-1Y TaxID=3078265 RepID=UPI0028EDC2E2|nr:glycosyltransferase [Sphingomonas sp. Y38-1Y]
MTIQAPARAGHILSFAQTLAGGGVERVLLRLAGSWAQRGRRVTLVIGDATGPLAAELPGGVEVAAGGGGGYAALAVAARRQARALAPDVIFCPGNHYTGVAASVRPFVRAPIVAKLSNSLAGTHRGVADFAYRRWLSLHPRFVDHLVAMTPASAAEAERLMHMPRARLSVIANPPAVTRGGAAAIPLPAGRFILGVGRLAPQKRWDRLIAVMPLLDPDVALVILGEGALRPALEAQVAALNLSARVHLPGHVADSLPAMARATVVALTSEHEGVPGAIREALGQGTPVVSTDSSVAIPELIDSPAKGSIVARGEEDALVAALAKWLAPGAPRPLPTIDRGDPAGDYLALFDALVSAAPPRRGARR